jgi:hypothetical protein
MIKPIKKNKSYLTVFLKKRLVAKRKNTIQNITIKHKFKLRKLLGKPLKLGISRMYTKQAIMFKANDNINLKIELFITFTIFINGI